MLSEYLSPSVLGSIEQSKKFNVTQQVTSGGVLVIAYGKL